MSLWNIKEVTKMTGATVNALRYYDKTGVVKPTVKEEGGRKRWLYNDEAIEKLKKLFLLKYIGVSVKEIDRAISSEDECREVVMKRLKELKKERDMLEQQIFIAQILAVSDGMDIFSGESPKEKAAIVNDALRKYIKKGVERNEEEY